MQDRIYSILVEQNEISWKTIILDLINSEQMDPWDVDVSQLTQKYIEKVRELKEQSLKVGGKVVLAASMLLRIKSSRLVSDDLEDFDRLLAGNDVSAEAFYDGLEQELAAGEQVGLKEDLELLPRMPQARRRKVSVFDLVRALEKALEVKQRRVLNTVPPPLPLPERKFDLTAAIQGLHRRILSLFGARKKLTFTDLLPGESREEKVYTFMPLLHLSNQRKVDLVQNEAFGEIQVHLVEAKNVQ
ncbi:segregation/condensation protein A [Candidatus Woesearchaeota archaeon]|nr:MAG: segregation/condensation protein A [Candidatus Woesearchaeota archaeon]